jgi:hypothetical protein
MLSAKLGLKNWLRSRCVCRCSRNVGEKTEVSIVRWFACRCALRCTCPSTQSSAAALVCVCVCVCVCVAQAGSHQYSHLASGSHCSAVTIFRSRSTAFAIIIFRSESLGIACEPI